MYQHGEKSCSTIQVIFKWIRLDVQMEYMKKLIKNSILDITQRIKRESLFKKLSRDRKEKNF